MSRSQFRRIKARTETSLRGVGGRGAPGARPAARRGGRADFGRALRGGLSNIMFIIIPFQYSIVAYVHKSISFFTTTALRRSLSNCRRWSYWICLKTDCCKSICKGLLDDSISLSPL